MIMKTQILSLSLPDISGERLKAWTTLTCLCFGFLEQTT
jgi:hypothetical protein